MPCTSTGIKSRGGAREIGVSCACDSFCDSMPRGNSEKPRQKCYVRTRTSSNYVTLGRSLYPSLSLRVRKSGGQPGTERAKTNANGHTCTRHICRRKGHAGKWGRQRPQRTSSWRASRRASSATTGQQQAAEPHMPSNLQCLAACRTGQGCLNRRSPAAPLARNSVLERERERALRLTACMYS